MRLIFGGGYSGKRKIICDSVKLGCEYEVIAMYENGDEADLKRVKTEEEAQRVFDSFVEKYAGRFQAEVYRSNLVPGERYTMFTLGDFGFPIAYQFTLVSVEYVTYAQYDDVVTFTVRRKGKRKNERFTYYGKSIQIYHGWQTMPDHFGFEVLEETDESTLRKSKYVCFDNRYMEDVKKVFKNPALIYDGSKIGKNGRRYA